MRHDTLQGRLLPALTDGASVATLSGDRDDHDEATAETILDALAEQQLMHSRAHEAMTAIWTRQVECVADDFASRGTEVMGDPGFVAAWRLCRAQRREIATEDWTGAGESRARERCAAASSALEDIRGEIIARGRSQVHQLCADGDEMVVFVPVGTTRETILTTSGAVEEVIDADRRAWEILGSAHLSSEAISRRIDAISRHGHLTSIRDGIYGESGAHIVSGEDGTYAVSSSGHVMEGGMSMSQTLEFIGTHLPNRYPQGARVPAAKAKRMSMRLPDGLHTVRRTRGQGE